MKGSVVRVRADKGFCFVRGFEEQQDRFLHFSDLRYPADLVREGLVVEFDPETGPKGPRACRATVEGDKPPAAQEFEGLFEA